MLSTILPVHHLSDGRITGISSLPNVQSLPASTNSLFPSHATRGNASLHDLLPPAASSHPFQISYREHPVPLDPSLSSAGIFPITASEFQRYERNVLLYVGVFFSTHLFVIRAPGREYPSRLIRSNLRQPHFHRGLSLYRPIQILQLYSAI
jgi:hypothetical protein